MPDDQKQIESGPDAALHTLDRSLERFLAAARPEAVFGQPIVHGDTLVVPCAEVLVGMGFGVGSGSAHEADERGGGSGGGAGGRVLSRPVGAIVITPHSVSVRTVVDTTKVALAALTTLGFVLFWLARLSRATQPSSEGPSWDDLRRSVHTGD